MDEIEGKWFAVVNPHAGGGKTLAQWSKARRYLDLEGVSYEYETTECKYHASELAFNASKKGYRKFLAVGGDGTVHEVLCGIMNCIEDEHRNGASVSLSDFSLAVIPIGSGNDWIRSHGVPRDICEVVKMISENRFVPQDVVKVSFPDNKGASGCVLNSSYMINIGGIGLDSRVCDRVNRRKDKGESGKLLYVEALIHNLFKSHPMDVSIICDGSEVYDGSALSIAFGTGRYSGGGMLQTPDAVVDDGLLDVTVIPPFSLLRIAREAPKLFNGKLLSVKEIVRNKARCVEVVQKGGEKTEMVELDGEIAGNVPVRFEVLDDKINVLHSDVR